MSGPISRTSTTAGAPHPGLWPCAFRLRRRRRDRGFTLLELLVALAIFAIMATAVYNSLAMLLRTSARLDEEGARLRELQTAMQTLERDLEQLVNRPVRGAYGQELEPLLWPGLDDRLELTSGGRSNPLRRSRCTLQRVAWQLRDGKLQRLAWPVLDQAQDSEPLQRSLLAGVSRFELEFLAGREQTFAAWPPDNPPPGLPPLPRAVRVSLEVAGWGRLERLFLPAGGA